MTTPYHAKYLAHVLTIQVSSDSLDKLTRSMANAKVDLNPHQVDAALFALRSPLSRGVIFADEVGLGKTIEAGLVISQRWAERKRKILLILPATLRKQWQMELEEKFYLPTLILETGTYNRLLKEGFSNPFEQINSVIICSYHFAAARAGEIGQVAWDMVVIDEAHRLRNVYKTSNKMAHSVKSSLTGVPKLLLTATPLQNSLMELYGLASVIDEHVFGDTKTFREQFVHEQDEELRNRKLKERIKALCTRTLRKHVLEYVRYTRRIPITQEFLPTDAEQQLYEDVSFYLQRQLLLALPAGQRSLMTLVLRKLLASSTFAIAGALHKLIKRLEDMEEFALISDLAEDFDGLDEMSDEWDEKEETVKAVDPFLLQEELAVLRKYAELAKSIQQNAKGEALLVALEKAFEQTTALGAAARAVIFTESRRTQQYLFDLLTDNGYNGQIVLFNGSNNDSLSKAIYKNWVKRHEEQDIVTGSPTADIRAALIEEFKDRAKILIATESAAEGVNLQFCSLVVNYDLPWNPQRIEQRIGRCHRYGQNYDVVVVNFLNRRNEADQRVYGLLAEKFKLFDGVFGASDEVLGALESGVDLEKRIAQVYQECRTRDEIATAFDRLQAELESKISTRLIETRQTLLDNFDEDVHLRLKLHEDNTVVKLSEHEQQLLALAEVELAGQADFMSGMPRFCYYGNEAPKGMYHLNWKEAEKNGDIFFRAEHALARKIIDRAAGRKLPVAHLNLDYSDYGMIISSVQAMLGQSGWLEVSKLSVETLEIEEFLLFSAQSDDGTEISEEICHKLMKLPAVVLEKEIKSQPSANLKELRHKLVQERLKSVENRNAGFFNEEVDKLDRWSDDLKFGLEREIKDLDKQLKEFRRRSTVAISLTEKLAAQKELKAIEKKRTQKRRDLYAAQDEIDARRDELIESIERQMKQKHIVQVLFAMRWTLV